MTKLGNLKPSSVWMYFEEITKIPRPSKQEEKMIAYVTEFAKSHKLSFEKDATGNVLIRKPAAHGL